MEDDTAPVAVAPGTTATEAVEVFVDALEYPPEDPRAAIAAVALILAAEMDRAPSATVAKELRSHIEWIGLAPNDEPGFVDEIRARRAQRRAALIVKDLTPAAEEGGRQW